MKKIIVEKNHDSNVNSERTVVTFFQDQQDTFGLKINQVRIIVADSDVENLGNHWREYDEIYGVIGQAVFTLEDMISKKRESHTLKTGDRIYVPAKTALRVSARKGSVIYIGAEETNREKFTHKYEITTSDK